ncbi:MAG: hypothetical protein P1U56_06305 [Saprospiraceae bacterium]|nr:hypothetical protein [Saprospiraceae bacterium]
MKQVVFIFSILSLCLYFPYSIQAQNVGINTTLPSARLHVKGNTFIHETLKPKFEEGTFAPGTNTGDVDWYITETDAFSGTKSIKCPLLLNQGDQAVLEFNFTQAHQKSVTIEFYYKYIDAGTALFGISTNEGDYFPPETPSSWKYFSTTYTSSGTENVLKIKVSATQNEATPLILVDDLKVMYEDGQALKIEDGNQGEGYILESDNLGHVKWVDLRSEIEQNIDQAILDEAQQLHFSETNSELSISEGNTV